MPVPTTPSLPPEKQDSGLMRAMFHTIAPRYDFITRAFSYGMDRGWKRLGVRQAALSEHPLVLDLASGTGDFAALARQNRPQGRAVAVDLTERMLRRARLRGIREAVCADALHLPFADALFDCVFVGYGLRNFPHLEQALREVERVTRPGGLLVTLDFFLPANLVLRKVYLGYLYAQGTFWGLILHGRARVYTYIPDSLRTFVSMEDFSGMLRNTGYGHIDQRSYVFGGIGLLWAAKEVHQGGDGCRKG
jgi:demethylmenaquinone methyltransferase / 2-methoxy-6-polyprenyl-1,4-benzoquinol methylase